MVINVHHVIYLWRFNPLIKSPQHENCDVSTYDQLTSSYSVCDVTAYSVSRLYCKNKVWRAGHSWIFRARKAWWSHLQARMRSLIAC